MIGGPNGEEPTEDTEKALSMMCSEGGWWRCRSLRESWQDSSERAKDTVDDENSSCVWEGRVNLLADHRHFISKVLTY